MPVPPADWFFSKQIAAAWQRPHAGLESLGRLEFCEGDETLVAWQAGIYVNTFAAPQFGPTPTS
jgi:hypothetical protein